MPLGALCSGPWSGDEGYDTMKRPKDRRGELRDWWSRLWVWLTLLVLLAIAVVLVVCFWEDIRHWAYDDTMPNGDTLRSLVLAFAAVIGLTLAIWRSFVANRQAEIANRQAETANKQAKAANRQAGTSELGLRNERYQKGAEMLGSDMLAICLGGIHALARLAREHPEEHHVGIMELLCAFVRHPTKTKAESETDSAKQRLQEKKRVFTGTTNIKAEIKAGDAEAAEKNCPPYVGAAAKAVGECRRLLSDEGRLKDIEGDLILNLIGATLEGAILKDANLEGAILFGANLEGAILFGAHLEYATLFRANLEGAGLHGAHLTGAHLEYATLFRANLKGAGLHGADLEGAGLHGADLEGAGLHGADLHRRGPHRRGPHRRGPRRHYPRRHDWPDAGDAG